MALGGWQCMMNARVAVSEASEGSTWLAKPWHCPARLTRSARGGGAAYGHRGTDQPGPPGARRAARPAGPPHRGTAACHDPRAGGGTLSRVRPDRAQRVGVTRHGDAAAHSAADRPAGARTPAPWHTRPRRPVKSDQAPPQDDY
eukprot:768800-Hanusia_phi.AAC.3